MIVAIECELRIHTAPKKARDHCKYELEACYDRDINPFRAAVSLGTKPVKF